MPSESPDPNDFDEIEYLRRGGDEAVANLYSRHRESLERMVEFRMDRRLFGRVDPADILQEAYIEIARRAGDYVEDPKMSFFVWARQITWQTLLMTHRRHFGTQKRNAAQEVGLDWQNQTDATAVSLASMLVGSMTSPSHAAMRDERMAQLRTALDTMDPIDREVLALRHFEHLSNKEVAEVLGIQKTTASNRYVRALERLRIILSEFMNDHE